MEALLAGLPKGRKPKYNWDLIERDMDAGMGPTEIARKHSMPMGTVTGRMRERRLRFAKEAREEPSVGSGGPAVYSKPCQVVIKNQEISSPETLIPSDFSEKDLETVLSDPAAILALPAVELQKLLARKAGLLVAQGMASVRAPESVKELVPLAKLYRDMAGLTGDKAKSGDGLLSPTRSFGRRPVAVVDVTPVRTEPEGGWPEGMMD